MNWRGIFVEYEKIVNAYNKKTRIYAKISFGRNIILHTLQEKPPTLSLSVRNYNTTQR